MTDPADALRSQVARQLAHWELATATLDDPANFAGEVAWQALERTLDLALRTEMQAAVDRLRRELAGMRRRHAAARTADDLERLREDLVAFRRRHGQVETVLDYYGDAVNTRTGPRLATLLAACDRLAAASLEQVLPPLGRRVPPVLTYIDKGLGASILKAGLRLWDPAALSPVASVKLTRHNLYRPTSLIHETGHQAAHSLGWNEQLAAVLERAAGDDAAVGRVWAGWASEIAADVFAFVTTGYGAVAALHDVLAGTTDDVFRYLVGDPHPIAYLRVLLNTEWCRACWGPGPWDDLAAAWTATHPVDRAPAGVRDLVQRSRPLLPRLAAACLRTPLPAFGGRPVTSAVDPARVSPRALAVLRAQVGPALVTSPHYLQTEALRLLASSSLAAATEPERAKEIAAEFEAWMLRLGRLQPMAALPTSPPIDPSLVGPQPARLAV